MRELHNFIHGEQVESAGGKTAPLVDPSTGEAFAEAPVSSPEDVERALLSAKDAFGSWKRSTPSARSLALIRVADAIEARAEELVRTECENTGQAVRAHDVRRDPADGRPDPLLCRCRPPARRARQQAST